MYSKLHTEDQCPEWDDKMIKALDKRKAHQSRAISELLDGLEERCPPKLYKIITVVAEPAYEAGVEAEVHDLTT